LLKKVSLEYQRGEFQLYAGFAMSFFVHLDDTVNFSFTLVSFVYFF